MKQLINGRIVELEDFKDEATEIIENLKPTVEDEIAELREGLKKLEDLFTPLLKMLGGNK